eukprot:CAMPEP_0114546990 /NCGR_PEP_ID=MMETSP0114-20121206/4226_1 /TAXON_ID=31324 /ORGANISM="Goniomonas sp, Strain m" /LENGTH=119 /DNA_ID=CAMNT_0001731517 /DNA_START=6 /DNA_END=365 /DNA_ORIENTATION=+
MEAPSTIYRLLKADEWTTAQALGHYVGSDLDVRDGYIHLSTATQCRGTASLYFKGVTDLWVLAVDTASLGEGLKWDAVEAHGGDKYPHFYGGPLPLSAIKSASALPLGDDGSHQFPPME